MENTATSMSAYLERLIEARERDLKSLRRTLGIVRLDISAANGQAMPAQQPAPQSQRNPSTTKPFLLASALANYARSKEDRVIAPTEAMKHLLAQGLTTEKSKRFHTWHALNKTGVFTKIGHGRYALVETDDAENGTGHDADRSVLFPIQE